MAISPFFLKCPLHHSITDPTPAIKPRMQQQTSHLNLHYYVKHNNIQNTVVYLGSIGSSLMFTGHFFVLTILLWGHNNLTQALGVSCFHILTLSPHPILLSPCVGSYYAPVLKGHPALPTRKYNDVCIALVKPIKYHELVTKSFIIYIKKS